MMRKEGKFGKKEEGGENRRKNTAKGGEIREEGRGRGGKRGKMLRREGKGGERRGATLHGERGAECRYNSAHGTCRGFLVKKWSICVIVVQMCRIANC